ncbi:NADH peroxidase [Ligilactobacillus agilis DSM 20509]|uniref:NADH peroxidase n=1 Tax=Ligilactobacillus agilis DSM 20509 TaxID=1423718 RepID=A0A0R2A8H8_9LACO|nr:FAD-dependent oxidoreductase [Ligilactobacillus agilis]KRM63729.1 NADH peroxidase [Ligilactobacillus agilis DSM 20509]MCI5762609.1 FAD-dependent oxidoreductase [Ligilactobacillus agilis]
MKVIVVGSSHGGYEAVEGLLKDYPDAEIQWYEQGDFLSFLSCGMQLFLKGKVDSADKVRYMTPEAIRKRGVTLFEQTQVTSLHSLAHEIEVKDLKTGKIRTEHYDKLILSPGAVPMQLDVPGKELKNIYYMRGHDWALKLKEKVLDDSVKKVVVIGSGYIGIEAAEVFARAGKKVSVLDLLSRPLATYLDKELTDVITDDLDKHGVQVYGGQQVKEYVGKEKVSAVKTAQGEYAADLVVVAAGIKPNTSWLKGELAMYPNGIIKTDDFMRSSADDVFVVGDATLLKYNPGQTMLNVALATNARKQGRFAVKNLVAPLHPFPGVQGTSALPVFDYKFASSGLNETNAAKLGKKIHSVLVEDDFRMDFVPEKENAHVWFKLTYDPKTKVILGGQILSKHDLTPYINVISLAIKTKQTIYDLAYGDFFFQPEFDKPWNILNLAGLMAEQKEAEN